ncbi:MAG: recombination mediator RecR [Bifidobacteriaceae bacterium]|jgi:recombination protein RecR|nr:recombination mediator RecR [Bifidobacteriaceae bacterium]
MNYEDLIQKLIDQLTELPSIGPKSAERLAFYILSQPESLADDLSSTIHDARSKVIRCEICMNYTVNRICQICANPNRNDRQILLVASPPDLAAIERAATYKGKYHVLGGLLDPLSDITPAKLNIAQLESRIHNPQVQELILALNTNVEGEATAYYLTERLSRDNLVISRLGLGIPVGADIEYADEKTIAQALISRN